MIQRIRQFRIERLEDRHMLATYVVDSKLDVIDPNDGVLTLREALTAANASPDEDDVIRFAESSYGSILLTNGFLWIEDEVAINGPGADLITIDASGNDPTPLVNDGLGSRIFTIDFDLDCEAFPVVDIVGLTLTGGDTGASSFGFRGGAIRVLDFFCGICGYVIA